MRQYEEWAWLNVLKLRADGKSGIHFISTGMFKRRHGGADKPKSPSKAPSKGPSRTPTCRAIFHLGPCTPRRAMVDAVGGARAEPVVASCADAEAHIWHRGVQAKSRLRFAIRLCIES